MEQSIQLLQQVLGQVKVSKAGTTVPVMADFDEKLQIFLKHAEKLEPEVNQLVRQS